MKFNWKGILLWSNHFYGICAVLLSIESTLLLNHVIPNPYLLLLIYLGTIVFYTHAYLQESKTGAINERANWYKKHFAYLNGRQFLYTCFCIYIVFVKLNLVSIFLSATLFVKLVLLITGFLSAIYYMPHLRIPLLRSYRTNGILKSLAIAWVWTILCCFIPVWFYDQNLNILVSATFGFYFFQFYVYVLVLAILFDIKDVNKDQHEAVFTIAMTLGAAKTVKMIIAPLLILYYLFVIYGVLFMGLHPGLLLLQMPLVIVTYLVSLKVLKQKEIYINILLIDGLLVIKATLAIAFVLLSNAV